MIRGLETRTLTAILLGTSAGFGQNLAYEIDARITYDVVTNKATKPDTVVWGMPVSNVPSATLDLVIDKTGRVTGATRPDRTTNKGALLGQRLFGVVYPGRSTIDFALTKGSWGTPVKNVAPLTAASVDLFRTFIGDFYGLGTVVRGFIKDGNSGDYFSLVNGLGLDGKIELTVSGKSGMSITLSFKVFRGYGTGWYDLGVDGGLVSYSMGTDSASVSLKGITAFRAYFDRAKRTLSISKAPIIADTAFPYWVLGRSLDSFSGQVSASGNFTGTAHMAGFEFRSVSGSTTNGTFQDSNSTGFDLRNGLVPGDSISMAFTDRTGRMDLLIRGRLVHQPWTDLGKGLKGGSGIPILWGIGALKGLNPVTLTVMKARPNALALMGIGFGRLDAPLLGGTLIPDIRPPGVVHPATVDKGGNLALQLPWPPGLQSGFKSYFQCWIVDSTGPFGFAATNGLMAETL